MTAVLLIFGFLAITLWAAMFGRHQRLSEFASNRERGSTWEVYCTTLSSLVGGWMFFGLNAVGYEAGFVGIAIGVGYAIGLSLLVMNIDRIKRVMSEHRFDTLDEFIGHHFGTMAQGALAASNFFIFLSVIAAQFLAMTSFLRVIAPEFADWLPVAAAVAVVLYTSIGGYRGVAVTDIAKMVLLVIGLSIFAWIVLTHASPSEWASLPAQHRGVTGYGLVFVIGAVVFFPATILVRSDLWQRIVHAKSSDVARKAFLLTIPSLLVFYVVLTAIGVASRARLGPGLPPESAGLLLLHRDMLSLPVAAGVAQWLTAITTFGIFAALASTADNNLNIASLGLSKLIFKKEWMQVAVSEKEGIISSGERALLQRSRWLSLVVGLVAIVVSLILRDIVAVMVNAAWMMLLFLPCTIGALFFRHRSESAGLASVVIGLLAYIGGLLAGIPLKSAFLPGLMASALTYIIVLRATSARKA